MAYVGGTDDPGATGAPKAAVGTFRRYYALAIITLVSAFSMLDRHVMSILLEPVREDLDLTDGQMGLILSGFAYTYALFGVPLAMLADRWSRVNLIAIAVALWSAATMLSGATQNVWQMFLARFGVGASEAGASAPGQAYIGDIFPRHERGTAMALLTVASPLGLWGGLALGGWAESQYGWRAAFVIAGLPGLVLAPLVLFTLPKINRGMADGVTKPPPGVSPLEAMRTILGIPTLLFMFLGAMAQSLLSMGLPTWFPAFLERSHGLTRAEIGSTLSLALGLGSLLGHLAGGPLMDMMGRRDLRWHFWVPAISAPISGVIALGAFYAPGQLSVILLGVQIFVSGLFAGVMVATIMNLAPVTVRATASAFMLLVIYIFSAAVGQQFIGNLSDLFKPAHGEDSLRIALMWATATVVPAGIFFFLASRTYLGDIAKADERNRLAAAARGDGT